MMDKTIFNNLRDILSNKFQNDLLDEAINNLNHDSRIRFSNFAYVIRELIDIILSTKANDEDIKNCIWYVAPRENERQFNRFHKIKYMIQGGFEDGLFDTILSINLDSEIFAINKYFRDELSKQVHLNEKCFNYSKNEIEQKIVTFLEIINRFLKMIQDTKNRLNEFLVDEIEEFVNDALLSETISDLDLLSTHTLVDSAEVEDICINEITFNEIIGNITGTVHVDLQYGSDREVQNGFGDIWHDSYPFKLPFTINIDTANDIFKDFSNKKILEEDFIPEFRNSLNDNLFLDTNNIYIDTSSFYD